MPRALTLPRARATVHSASASLRTGRSKEFTSTRKVCFTASCGLARGSSARSMLRARAQGQARVPSLKATTQGAITGNYIDGSNANHGFVLDQQGSFSVFDVPGTG